jgi:2-polyprenyl-3-methyl-5-hydroxy-6-metoxy-1,4-benzoquinol methylase
MFGSEQRFIQSHSLLYLAYMILGEFRYPLRLRGTLMRRSLPENFQPKVIWDAGCGEGQTSFWLSKYFPCAQIISTDIKKENIERCNNIARNLKRNNINFMHKDVLEGSSQNVDLVVCCEVLEHIDSYSDALRSFSDSLVQDGFLLIHTPADNSFQSPTWGLRKFMHSEKEGITSQEKGQYHIRPGFKLDELTGEIEVLGFYILNNHYTFGTIAMFAHNIYEWTRSRSKIWQIVTLYPLLLIGYLDILLSPPNGAGILIVAQKK